MPTTLTLNGPVLPEELEQLRQEVRARAARHDHRAQMSVEVEWNAHLAVALAINRGFKVGDDADRIGYLQRLLALLVRGTREQVQSVFGGNASPLQHLRLGFSRREQDQFADRLIILAGNFPIVTVFIWNTEDIAPWRECIEVVLTSSAVSETSPTSAP